MIGAPISRTPGKNATDQFRGPSIHGPGGIKNAKHTVASPAGPNVVPVTGTGLSTTSGTGAAGPIKVTGTGLSTTAGSGSAIAKLLHKVTGTGSSSTSGTGSAIAKLSGGTVTATGTGSSTTSGSGSALGFGLRTGTGLSTTSGSAAAAIKKLLTGSGNSTTSGTGLVIARSIITGTGTINTTGTGSAIINAGRLIPISGVGNSTSSYSTTPIKILDDGPGVPPRCPYTGDDEIMISSCYFPDGSYLLELANGYRCMYYGYARWYRLRDVFRADSSRYEHKSTSTIPEAIAFCIDATLGDNKFSTL